MGERLNENSVMQIPFKKTISHGVITFQFSSGLHCHGQDQCAAVMASAKKNENGYRQTLQGSEFNLLLSLAAFLVAPKEKYALVRNSPDADLLFANTEKISSRWRYEVISNDFDGNGVDKGFVCTESAYSAYQISSPYLIEKLPEDVLEEEFSNVTIFGLKRGSAPRLNNFLTSLNIASLSDFMQEDEVFLNVRCGKSNGYFNSLLLKSKIDMQEQITEYENTTDAGN